MSGSEVIDVLLVAISLGGIYALMALGLTLVYGITRVFNFALGSFYLWGGYIAWSLHKGYFNLPYPLVFGITIVIMFFMGLAYERALLNPLRRFPDWEWLAIIVTLGSALFLDNLSLVIFGARGRTLPYLIEGNLTFGQFSFAKHDLAILLIAIAAMIALNMFLKKTRAGKAMQGVAQDSIGAAIVGIPSPKVFGYTFALTTALAGISGMLLAPRTQLYSYVGWPVLVKAMVVVVFGGLGSIKGTIVAAFTLAIVEAFVTYQIGALWALPIFLVILFVVLALRPRGLFGTW